MSPRWPYERRLAYWTDRVGERDAEVQARRERYAAICRARDCGLTYREIGEVFGVSLERARQVERKALRDQRHGRQTGLEYFDVSGLAGILYEETVLELFDVSRSDPLGDPEAVQSGGTIQSLEKQLAAIETEARNLRRRIAEMRSEERAARVKPADARLLTEVDIPARIVRALRNAGAYRICDIDKRDTYDLVKYPGLSKDAIHQVWKVTGKPSNFEKWLENQKQTRSSWYEKTFPPLKPTRSAPPGFRGPEHPPRLFWPQLSREQVAAAFPGDPFSRMRDLNESETDYTDRMARLKAAEAHLAGATFEPMPKYPDENDEQYADRMARLKRGQELAQKWASER